MRSRERRRRSWLFVPITRVTRSLLRTPVIFTRPSDSCLLTWIFASIVAMRSAMPPGTRLVQSRIT